MNAMAHWLFKTEPATFSWDDQVKAGSKGEEWNGVRNALAQIVSIHERDDLDCRIEI